MKLNPGFFETSIGKKFLMAGTGVLLLGFVLAHMAGHLQMFLGQNAYNHYAHTLKSLGPILWIMRIGLFLIFIIHVRTAAVLTRENRQARPIGYTFSQTIKASLASRTMIYTGLLVLVFVIYHLLHFTLGVIHPDHFRMTDSDGRPDVYSMMILGFRNYAISFSYFVAMAVLAFHLSHGFFSAFQTFGINKPEYDSKIKLVSNLLALFIFLGFISVPVSILAGIIQPL
ncbi:MAG: succinate dehydrogenase cytochrome b subunit [Leptospiraceae bacterium]|nr:succinate dehydrogenase cytochrome b subunit [Leptospiraceae bacterium]